MTTQHTPGPTEHQIALAAWADAVERHGPKTSTYYRLYPQVIEARAAIAWASNPDILVRAFIARNLPGAVVTRQTRASERDDSRMWRPHMCCMGDHGSRVSVAFSVWCLISDYHSIMDSWPRHADWSAVY